MSGKTLAPTDTRPFSVMGLREYFKKPR